MFSLLSALPADVSPGTLLGLLAILSVSAVMSGLSGFGFSAIGALCLWLLPPTLGVPLLMTLSSANQFMSLGQLKADLRPVREWWPEGPGPYLLGGLAGVPLGLSILHALPTTTLMAVFGGLLLTYATYSMVRPERPPAGVGGWRAPVLVGFAGGVIGGFTAFPGAAVVIWTGLRRLPKSESRAIVQPYILGLQLISLALLAIQHPETFGRTYWTLLAFCVPVVLPSTLLGVRLYKSLSDINFRRVAFMLLGCSGLGLLVKAGGALAAVAVVARLAR